MLAALSGVQPVPPHGVAATHAARGNTGPAPCCMGYTLPQTGGFGPRPRKCYFFISSFFIVSLFMLSFDMLSSGIPCPFCLLRCCPLSSCPFSCHRRRRRWARTLWPNRALRQRLEEALHMAAPRLVPRQQIGRRASPRTRSRNRRRPACPFSSRMMKQAPLSSISHGGVKRRVGSIIAAIYARKIVATRNFQNAARSHRLGLEARPHRTSRVSGTSPR